MTINQSRFSYDQPAESNRSLSQPLKCDTSPRRRTANCPKCTQQISLSNIERHTNACISSNFRPTKERAAKNLPAVASYVEHVLPTVDGMWICDQCSKSFQTRKGLAHHFWQRHTNEVHEPRIRRSNQFISGRQQSHSADTRKKLSQTSRANPAGVAVDPSLRSYAGRSKHYNVFDSFGNAVVLQSSWEYLLMIDLNANGILWRRPDPFWLTLRSKNGRPSSYTPDFWLPEFDLYLDPKSREQEEQSFRIAHWLNQYNKKLLIIRKKSQLTWAFVKDNL